MLSLFFLNPDFWVPKFDLHTNCDYISMVKEQYRDSGGPTTVHDRVYGWEI